jgi:formate/nitrite transporter
VSQPPDSPPPTLDPLLPAEIAAACERVGVRKTQMDAVSLFVLAILAGAFIALGAMFFTIVLSGTGLGWGPTQLLGGVAFSLGLVLVIIAGAELFTGNVLSVMAWASRKVTTQGVLRSWAIVYVGNFVGALLTALLVYASDQWQLNDAQVGGLAIDIGARKTALGFGEAVALGILANALVALAVWLSLSARSVPGKVLAIVFPISAFVAGGFEHSIANMYFIPLALFVKTEDAALAASTHDISELDWGSFVVANLIPVTLGNVIGGAVLVGAVYWFVYLRPQTRPPQPPPDGNELD